MFGVDAEDVVLMAKFTVKRNGDSILENELQLKEKDVAVFEWSSKTPNSRMSKKVLTFSRSSDLVKKVMRSCSVRTCDRVWIAVPHGNEGTSVETV